MKNLSVILFSLLFANGCNAQKNNKMTTQDSKTFDLEKFNNNKIDNRYSYITKDSTIVKQTDWGHEIIEIKKRKNSYFEEYSMYYPSGKIKEYGFYFPNKFTKGIWKDYDENGNLIKETDYDAPFTYTFEDILKFIKEREIDMSHYLFEITRNVIDDNKPIWSIVYCKSEEDMILGIIGIDGITGKITIESEQGFPEDD